MNPLGYERVVDQLARYDSLSPEGAWERVTELHGRIISEHPEELAALLLSFRALVAGSPNAEGVANVLATVLGKWMPEAPFPHASMYMVENSELLTRRYGVARAMLHTGDEAPEASTKGGLFSSSLDLVDDVNLGLGAYIEPLVTSLSPHVWAASAPRLGGTFVLVLGRPVSSTPLVDLDLLALSNRAVSLRSLPELRSINPAAYGPAVHWWASRLDLVFSHLTEPANHLHEGEYHAPAAVEQMLAFEQLCRSVQTVGASRDEHSRRLSMFYALDSLRGVGTELSRDRATTLTKMTVLLEQLRVSIPAEVQPLLLPRAETAVQALREVQDGFFMSARLRGDDILLPNKEGNDVLVPLATAARDWIRVLRNIQHGLDQVPSPRERALLAAHSGHVPDRLADLAWLSLLEILTFPEKLKRRPRRIA